MGDVNHGNLMVDVLNIQDKIGFGKKELEGKLG